MTEEISEQRQSRLNKLAKLEEMGYNPYPYRFKPDSFAKPLQEKYKELPAGENTEDRVTVAGNGGQKRRYVYRPERQERQYSDFLP